MMTDKELTAALAASESEMEQIRRLRDPDVRAIAVDHEVQKLDAKYTVDDLPMLAEDFKERFREHWHQKLLTEADTMDAAVVERHRAAREELTTRIEQAKRLPSYAARYAPDDPAYVGASLLDDGREARAEQFIDAQPLAAILAKYQQADEAGADRSFCRVLEARHAAKLPIGDVTGLSSEKTQALMRSLIEAIGARQHARVAERDRVFLATLEQREGRYAQVRAQHQPTKANLGAAVRASLKAVV